MFHVKGVFRGRGNWALLLTPPPSWTESMLYDTGHSVTSIIFRWSVRQREYKNKGDICVWTVWLSRGLFAANTSILLLQVLLSFLFICSLIFKFSLSLLFSCLAISDTNIFILLLQVLLSFLFICSLILISCFPCYSLVWLYLKPIPLFC